MITYRIKLQVSFAEYSLFYRALLQKRPMFLTNQHIIRMITNRIKLQVSFGEYNLFYRALLQKKRCSSLSCRCTRLITKIETSFSVCPSCFSVFCRYIGLFCGNIRFFSGDPDSRRDSVFWLIYRALLRV